MEEKNASRSPADGRHLPFPSKDLALLWRIPFPTEAEPDEIEDKVRRAIEDGGKAHTYLYPSATAITTMTARQRDNCIRYIEAGLRYGQF